MDKEIDGPIMTINPTIMPQPTIRLMRFDSWSLICYLTSLQFSLFFSVRTPLRYTVIESMYLWISGITGVKTNEPALCPTPGHTER
jgi:hypothetical protein